MPLFEFDCLNCGKRFETIGKLGEICPCPHCDATATQKLVSAHSMAGINTIKNPGLRETARREGKRERVQAMLKKQGMA